MDRWGVGIGGFVPAPMKFDLAPQADVMAEFMVPAALGQEDLAAGMALAGRLARHLATVGPAPFEVTIKELDLLRRVAPGAERPWTGSAMTMAEVPLVVVDPEDVERDRRRARQRQEAVEQLLGGSDRGSR